MVTHSTGDGLFVVEKGSPRRKLNPTDIPGLDAAEIRARLRLSDSKKLLLLFAWTVDDELRLFRMHPEVHSWDVTKKTNKEKRGLLMATGKDGNGRYEPVRHMFVATLVRSYELSEMLVPLTPLVSYIVALSSTCVLGHFL